MRLQSFINYHVISYGIFKRRQKQHNIMMIDVNIINTWGSSYDAKEGLPWLLRILLISSIDRESYDIQTGNQIFLSGFDGHVFSNKGTTYIPEGESIWEIGTEKTYKSKFDRDYTKRLDELGDSALNYSFCFTTPFLWHDYYQQEKSINSDPNRGWKRVKIHCASSLANWIEEHPWVKESFLKRIGCSELLGLNLLCEEYDSCTKCLGKKAGALDKIILSGREDTSQQTYKWIECNSNKFLEFRSSSIKEARHFIAVAAKINSDQNWDYWSTKIIFLNDDCDVFNYNYLHEDNILVTSASQYSNACRYYETTGCRVVFVLEKENSSLLLPPGHDTIKLENMSNDVTIQELNSLKYAGNIDHLLNKVNIDGTASYDILRNLLTGDKI